jgi:hypothetical protein
MANLAISPSGVALEGAPAGAMERPDFQIVRGGKVALLAYLIVAGLIEYAFLRDHPHGGALIVLTLSLVVFAVHVPVLIGFTVARYDQPADALADRASA